MGEALMAASAGIPLKHRLGVQYHAWENNLDFGFGIRHYGDKWGDATAGGSATGC